MFIAKASVAVVLTLGLIAVAEPAKKEVGPTTKLPAVEAKGVPEGTWRMTSVVVGGKRLFEGSEDMFSVEITKEQLTLKSGGTAQHTATIKVDAGKKPAWFDQTFTSGPGKGKTVNGIFEIKDGVLTISHGSENGERPTGFDDPKAITRTFKREGK